MKLQANEIEKSLSKYPMSKIELIGLCNRLMEFIITGKELPHEKEIERIRIEHIDFQNESFTDRCIDDLIFGRLYK